MIDLFDRWKAINRTIMEYVGCVIGLAGAVILAFNQSPPHSVYYCYLTSNIILTIYAIRCRQYGVAGMNAGFLIVNIIGLYKHW